MARRQRDARVEAIAQVPSIPAHFVPMYVMFA